MGKKSEKVFSFIYIDVLINDYKRMRNSLKGYKIRVKGICDDPKVNTEQYAKVEKTEIK